MDYIIPTKKQEKTLYDVMDFPLEESSKPVFDYRYYDAIRYCNDLSKKEGLEPCYLYEGEPVFITTNFDGDIPDFELNEKANGYRLPTLEEYKSDPPDFPCWAWGEENRYHNRPVISYTNGEERIVWKAADDHSDEITFYLVRNK